MDSGRFGGMMNTRRKPLLLLIALLALTAPIPAHATKWALLVGVNDYENPDITPLHYAVDDVQAVAADLKARVGFADANVNVMTSDVSGVNRPTNVNVLKRLDSLSRRIKPGDTFLFYFSGHGFFPAGGQHFLATVNSDPSTLQTLEVTSLPMAYLRDGMSKIHASNVIFIIDACRNDPESGKGGGDNLRTPGFTRDLKTVITSSNAGQAGTALLFACGEHERSYEEPEWKHGVFTHFLLEGIDTGKAADPRGELTMASLAQYVQGKVGAWSDDNDKQQHPDLEQQGAAQIVLADRFVDVKPVVVKPVVVTPTPPVKPVVRPVTPVHDDVKPFVDNNVTPQPTVDHSTFAPIMPDTPDAGFAHAVLEALNGTSSKFKSYRGMIDSPLVDSTGTWDLFSYTRSVPGFKSGLVHIHGPDGNYYILGNYVEFEYNQSWKPADVDAAITELRKLAGEVLAATGETWKAKVVHPDGVDETDIVVTRGESQPQNVTLRLTKDRKSNSHIFLDISDGLH